ncbi:hypothetical protein [Butyrivibrio sp. AE3004]|nr:hypothetical protein [Butyrivibrio sp. AE3004]
MNKSKMLTVVSILAMLVMFTGCSTMSASNVTESITSQLYVGVWADIYG